MGTEEYGDIRHLLSHVPVTVLIIVGIAHWFATTGYYHQTSDLTILILIDPVYYAGSLFLHRDWSHYWSNIVAFVPLGIILTWLTTNRHVLAVIVISTFLTTFSSILTVAEAGFGMSGVVYALFGAVLVRGVHIASESYSEDALKIILVGVLVPLVAGLYTVAIVDRASNIGHMAHLYGFVFGCAVEAIYVFSERKGEESEEGDEYTFRHGT